MVGYRLKQLKDIVLFMFEKGCELCFAMPTFKQGSKNNNLRGERKTTETQPLKAFWHAQGGAT